MNIYVCDMAAARSRVEGELSYDASFKCVCIAQQGALCSTTYRSEARCSSVAQAEY